jgi:DNA polymerase III alpha subunit
VDGCSDALYADSTCEDIIKGKTGRSTVAVEILEAKEIVTKNGKNPGQKMAFITATDTSSSCDNIVCFPDEWNLYKELLYQGNTLLIYGEKGKKNSFIIKKAVQI